MKYHHVCIQCGNTTPEEQTNIVITDIMDNETRAKQVYCAECFKSLNKDIIAKNKKHSTKNNKREDLHDIDKSCCGH